METDKNEKYNTLTPEEQNVIIYKGTELPFTGKYNNSKENGIYICKRCNAQLYKSEDKFSSQCGWPSFDDQIPNAITQTPDSDGRRTEITCANCGTHLGHIFLGEGFTKKNIRHCVNSLSLNFKAEENEKIDSAIFAGGCFWGMQYYFNTAKGVIKSEVGYIGGNTEDPTYDEVCNKKTGHIEAIKIVFDTSKTNFEEMAKLFFEIHDPTQLNKQGPDIGEQYKSAIFYSNEEQKEISLKLIKILESTGLKVVTELIPQTTFWVAEKYHQNYYDTNGNRPYCHFYKKKF